MPLSAPPPSWASIKNKPTTVSGFGISDMATQTVANATNVSNVTTAQVLAAEAGATVGAVGTYAYLIGQSGTSGSTYTTTEGSTHAGSGLRYGGNDNGTPGSTVFGASIGAAPAGTWRCMGRGGSGFAYPMTLFLRIA